jgi:hypothetical protein
MDEPPWLRVSIPLWAKQSNGQRKQNVCLDLNQHAEIVCRLSIMGKSYTSDLESNTDIDPSLGDVRFGCRHKQTSL